MDECKPLFEGGLGLGRIFGSMVSGISGLRRNFTPDGKGKGSAERDV